jgi:hypothetical protein
MRARRLWRGCGKSRSKGRRVLESLVFRAVLPPPLGIHLVCMEHPAFGNIAHARSQCVQGANCFDQAAAMYIFLESMGKVSRVQMVACWNLSCDDD